MSFDLLRRQLTPARKLTLTSLSTFPPDLTGALAEHPEWEWVAIDPATLNTIPSTIGGFRACFTPYTEYLAEQITETLELF